MLNMKIGVECKYGGEIYDRGDCAANAEIPGCGYDRDLVDEGFGADPGAGAGDAAV